MIRFKQLNTLLSIVILMHIYKYQARIYINIYISNVNGGNYMSEIPYKVN